MPAVDIGFESLNVDFFCLFKLVHKCGRAKVFEERAVNKAVEVRAVERKDKVAFAELVNHRARNRHRAVGRLRVSFA